jgi:5-methylcytosine-specific restriction endonuclease McrA
MSTTPSAERQIEFLKKIQTLFEDSFFQATYKYALLITLTDLAIEHGEDDGEELFLDKKWIGERFAELYWTQIQPFPSGVTGSVSGVLFHSDKNDHIKIVKDLLELSKEAKTNDFLAAQNNAHWSSTLSDIAKTVWTYPIFHLQDDSNQFLYEYPTLRNGMVLKPGVAYCLRKFSEYIIQYARNGWIDHIKKTKRNQPILGIDNDLESFLFGSTRKKLTSLRDYLLNHQSGRCFYCNNAASSESDIDHFIPWKKYPRNLAQNLVLACPKCNRSKSDMLAAKIYLDKWLDKVLTNDARSLEINKIGFISDRECTYKVSSWAYTNGVESNSLAWERPNIKIVMDKSYIEAIAKFNS